MKIFVDLEDTLVHPIDGWSNARLMDRKQIKNICEILQKHNVDEIEIFSFAIATKFDQRAFDHFLKARIETILGVKITSAINHSEMMRHAGYKNTHNDTNYLSDLMKIGKRNCFLNFSKNQPTDMILIDDVVESEIVNNVEFINAIF